MLREKLELAEEAKQDLHAAMEVLRDVHSRLGNKFRIESLKDQALAIRRLVLAPDWAEFMKFCDELKPAAHHRFGTGQLDLPNMVAMSIMRVRHDLTLEFLAILFFGDISQVSNVQRMVIDTWALIDAAMFDKEVYLIPHDEILSKYTPVNFAEALPGAILVIDATYEYHQRPSAAGVQQYFIIIFSPSLTLLSPQDP
jgi:hypothetical protein